MTAEEIALQMELDLIENISKAVGSGKIGTAEWYLQKLSETGNVNQRNLIIIQGYIDPLDSAMESEIRKALQKRLNVLDDAFLTSGFKEISVVAEQSIQDLILSYSTSTAGTANKIGANLLAGSSKAYNDTLTLTQSKVLAGISTPQEALRQTLNDWTGRGLPALIDKAGRQWQPDSYVNMQIRTAETAGYTDMTLTRNDQYGNDLIEVDSHVGAREGCEPYQGKVYSQSGQSEQFPALSSTSMGEADGLFGINCRHNAYPYFPGLSEKTSSPFPKKQNEKAYANSQTQRFLERDIRKAKRQVAGVESAGLDASKEKAKVRQKQENMRNFIDDTGRARQRSKEQI